MGIPDRPHRHRGQRRAQPRPSRRRARAISAWFKGHGLKSPIAYEGLGESSPAVKTADEVDEPRNRRVDYILALDAPRLPSGEYSWKVP